MYENNLIVQILKKMVTRRATIVVAKFSWARPSLLGMPKKWWLGHAQEGHHCGCPKSIHSGVAAALGPGLGSPRPPTTEAKSARDSGGWTRESRALGQAEALGQAARPATTRVESRGPAHRKLLLFKKKKKSINTARVEILIP